MDPAVATLRRDRAIRALVPLFLTSGATSLVYETLWERQLHLVVGTSQIAVITVLTSFMAGLALGGFLASRVADRVPRPLVTYALLEGAIGLYALFFPVLIGLLAPLYTGFWDAFHPSPAVFAGFQFLLLGLSLLPPTICMGATLPLLTRFAATTTEDAGRRVGMLYGANTLGAVLGVALAGFVLLPSLGLTATTYLTAAGNLGLCLVAGFLGVRAGEVPPAADDAPAAGHVQPTLRWLPSLAVLAALGGFSALVYEVAWFRLMVLILGGSAYAFSLMLLAFLLGIGAGGWGGGRLADRAWSRGGAWGVLRLAAGLQVGTALLAWLSMYAYGELPFAFVRLYTLVESAPEWIWPAKLLLALSVMFPPALLMGATFPVLVRAATRSTALGKPVGRLYGWNTVGAILGASIGGIVLLPGLHVRGTVLFAISVNLLAALIALRGSALAGRGLPSWKLQVAWGVALMWAVGLLQYKKPPWDELLMTAGMYKYVSELEPDERSRQEILDFAVAPYDLVFYDEGLSSVVTVARAKDGGNIWLANNGKVDASTRVDMPTQVLVAHLPFIYKPAPREVMVIGLASGITAGSVALHEKPELIEIIEIEPAIIEASRVFDPYNNRPLEDPRVTLITNDGRNHLMLQPDGRYDLIVSEPSNPWLTGVSNLFTAEFFAMGKSKLAEGGVWAQWVQMYGMDQEDLKSLLATFTDAYAHVHLFSTIEDADLVLIGSDSPMDLSVRSVQHMMDLDAGVTMDLRHIEVDRAEDVLSRFQLDRDQIRAYVGDVERNTDDNMRIEYSAPLQLHKSTADSNFLSLLDEGGARESVPMWAVEGVEGRIELARAYAVREDWLRALICLRDAEALEPGREDVGALYAKYQVSLLDNLDRKEDED